MPDRLTASVEVRATEAGPMLRATILQEGRAATGGRAEVFAPLSVVWPSDGIAIRAEHRGAELARAIPSREPNGEIRIAVKATDAIRRAVDVDGKRHASIEFVAERESRTAGGVREIQRAMVDAAALVSDPEYTQTRAEVRARRRRYSL